MSQSAKIGTLVVAIIVIAGGAYFFSSRNSGSTSSTTETTTTTPTSSATTNASDRDIAPTTTPSPSPSTSSSTTPSPTQTTSADHTVTYENNAFSPSTVTIKVGETVAFVNKASNTPQIASDPHPTHTDYLPLNVGALSPGSTSSPVSFTKAGTFGYHNHSNSSQAGKIIVQ